MPVRPLTAMPEPVPAWVTLSSTRSAWVPVSEMFVPLSVSIVPAVLVSVIPDPEARMPTPP